MNPIITIALLAALADGTMSDQEKAEIRRIVTDLAAGSVDMLDIYDQVVSGKITVEQAVSGIAAPADRKLAYELAYRVCNADGAINDREAKFLQRLQQALDLSQADIAPIQVGATDINSFRPEAADHIDAAVPDSGEIDSMIRRYAVTAGALEILPQSLATMAILPMQLRMVYKIGKKYGYELSQAHIREFIAVAGVGYTSQVVESLLRGLARKLGGRMVSAATGMSSSFVTTYALGHAAKMYYSGGRKMDTAALKQLFTTFVAEAKGIATGAGGEIRNAGKDLDVSKLLGAP